MKAPLCGGAFILRKGGTVYIKRGRFFFITDEFYERYDSDKRLMQNKEGTHNRPCFYTFSDTQNANILWCVPISSQVSKFHKIVAHKLEMQKNKGIAFPKCNTIRFGRVMGKEKAFLIQNMFPITARYINNVYIDPNTRRPVTIEAELENDICKNAQDILKLVFHGHEYLVFSDIRKIYRELIAELQKYMS